MHLKATNRSFCSIVREFKLDKRMVRYGNLNYRLRVKFWIRSCPFFILQEEMREELQVSNKETRMYYHVLE